MQHHENLGVVYPKSSYKFINPVSSWPPKKSSLQLWNLLNRGWLSENKILFFNGFYKTSLRWLMASFEVLKSQYGCGENHKIKRHDDVGWRFQFIFPWTWSFWGRSRVLFPPENIRQICHIVQVLRRLKPKHDRSLCKSAARTFQNSILSKINEIEAALIIPFHELFGVSAFMRIIYL